MPARRDISHQGNCRAIILQEPMAALSRFEMKRGFAVTSMFSELARIIIRCDRRKIGTGSVRL